MEGAKRIAGAYGTLSSFLAVCSILEVFGDFIQLIRRLRQSIQSDGIAAREAGRTFGLG